MAKTLVKTLNKNNKTAVKPLAVSSKLIKEDHEEALRCALGKPKSYKSKAKLNTDNVAGKKRIKGKKNTSSHK